MRPMYQILIVLTVLALLPTAAKLLWKLRLLPLAMYLTATRLFWPDWTEGHPIGSYALLAACVLFFAACWLAKLIRHRKEQRALMEYARSNATKMMPGMN